MCAARRRRPWCWCWGRVGVQRESWAPAGHSILGQDGGKDLLLSLGFTPVFHSENREGGTPMSTVCSCPWRPDWEPHVVGAGASLHGGLLEADWLPRPNPAV